jgi:DNA-binding PadR family transcriptional regulator
LFEIEERGDPDMESYGMNGDPDNTRRHYHFMLLEDAGLVRETGSGYYRLTAQGHDFLDAIRDEGIWARTKDAVQKTGGNVTLEILKTLATALLKKKVSQHTGIEL